MRIIILGLLLIYIISPIDLIPDLFKPIGLLDDAVALWVFYRILRKYSRWQDFVPFFFRAQEPTIPNQNYSEDRSQKKQTPWDILGISKNATSTEIKTAYRQRSSEYHPDKVQHLGQELRELADKKFLEIQKAFESLQKQQ